MSSIFVFSKIGLNKICLVKDNANRGKIYTTHENSISV